MTKIAARYKWNFLFLSDVPASASILLLIAVSYCEATFLEQDRLPHSHLSQLMPPKPVMVNDNIRWKSEQHLLDLADTAVERQMVSQILQSVREVELPLTNGTGEYELNFVFRPVPGTSIESYNFLAVSSNVNVLSPDDVAISKVDAGNGEYNISAFFDFDKSVGVSEFHFNVVDKVNKTTISSPPILFTIAGISFFYYSGTSNRQSISTGKYPLTLSVSQLLENPNVNLEAFVQYMDGTNSSTRLDSLFPLDQIGFRFGGLKKQLLYDASKCSANGGTYNGEDVLLPASCGIGFSSNRLDGAYVGPWLGFDFETNRNGSFVIVFEWDDLLVGSDYEDAGYETFINVDVVGEAAPIITNISPRGPFGSAGRDNVTFVVENIPLNSDIAAKWRYNLSIYFDDVTVKEASLSAMSSNSDGSTALTFGLPPGVGVALPWSLTAIKPDGKILEAVDQSNLNFTFTFKNSVFISRISPNRGTEVGGTVVQLNGFFPNIDLTSSNSFISFGSGTIANDQVLSVSESEIVFLTPPASDATGGTSDGSFNVTVTANSLESNTVVYTYLNKAYIADMIPTSGPLEGGTKITLTGTFATFMSTPGSTLVFGTHPIDPSSILVASQNSIEFLSPPHNAVDPSNSTYRFPVAIQVNGRLSNSVDFLYEVPVVLHGMSPVSGPEEGNTTVILSGKFVNFHLSNSGVYFDGFEIDKSLILQSNETHIVFRTPAREELGASSTYAVSVQINQFSSQSIDFTFQVTDFSVHIDASGGSLNEVTKLYEIGLCGNTLYTAVIPLTAQAQNASYEWTLRDSITGVNILSERGFAQNAKSIFLPYDFFPIKGRRYDISVTVTTAFKSVTASKSLIQLTAQRIGVKIAPPAPVSPSNPNVTLTIQSDITIPRCSNADNSKNSADISYIWEFRGEIFLFSHQNLTVDESKVGPTLLGREFIIPQALMRYGTFPLKLTAYNTENVAVRGSDTTLVQIKPSALISQINAGQVETKVSDAQDITMTGSLSRDPDVLTDIKTADLEYSWTCHHGWDETLLDSIACGADLLPSRSAKSFTVAANTLSNFRNSTAVYIQYKLTVSKMSKNATNADITRVSKPVTSTLILSELEGVAYEPLVDIAVYDNLTSPIDPSNVKYFQDVIISPISSNPSTTWTFELLEPRSQRTLLLVSANLIPFSGFWSVGSSAGRNLLGLLPNTLLPGTTYKFLIRSSRSGFEVNEDVLELKTVQNPKLTLTPISDLSGDWNYTFILSASTNYNGDFKFYFWVTDEFGYKSCVDGCQGTSVVRFRIASPGIYNISCEVYDSLGFARLAIVFGKSNITVTSSVLRNLPLSIFDEDLNSSFVAGDHADFQQLGVDLVKYVLSNNGSVSPSDDSERLTNYTKLLSQIVSNSVPNSVQSASYVKTAAALVRLTPDLEITYSSEALYDLVNITVNSVTRTPDSAALQQLEYLLDFYSQTPQLILAGLSFGSSRQRIMQRAQADNMDEFSVLLIDFYEVMKDVIGVVALKPCSCGCVLEFSTHKASESLGALGQRYQLSRQLSEGTVNDRVGKDDQKTPAALYENKHDSEMSNVLFQVAHICNPEQGLELSLAIEGTEETNTFRWCKELFEDQFKNLYFMFVRTPNYVYIAGIRRNTTLTDGLTTSVVAELAANNTFVNVASPIPDCFTYDLVIPRLVGDAPNQSSQLGADQWEQQRPQACRLEPVKKWGISVSDLSHYYAGIFRERSNTTVTDSLMDAALSIASFRDSMTGTFTVATKIAWDGGFFSLEGLIVTLGEVSGLVVTVAVIIALATAGAFMIATRYVVSEVGEAPVDGAFTYVERDVYGRGTAIDMPEQEPFDSEYE